MIVYRFKVWRQPELRLARLCKCGEKKAQLACIATHVVKYRTSETRLFFMDYQATAAEASDLARRAILGELPGVDLS